MSLCAELALEEAVDMSQNRLRDDGDYVDDDDDDDDDNNDVHNPEHV